MRDRPTLVSAAEDERVAAASQLAPGLEHELPTAVAGLDRKAGGEDGTASGEGRASVAFGDRQLGRAEQSTG